MKNKKKKANKPFRPPLSTLDKAIYSIAFVVAAAIVFPSIYCFFDIRELIAFREPEIIAEAGHFSSLIAVPFLLFSEGSLIGLILWARSEKKPIFGNRKITYGKEPWRKDYYPLFDPRRKTVSVLPSEKRLRRRLTAVWCAVLLLTVLMVPFGFFGRDCLLRDNSVTVYNALNRQTEIYTTEQYSSLTLEIRYTSPRYGASYWAYHMKLKMKDGKSFSFSNNSFNWREERFHDIALDKMLEIKQLFPPEAITIKGAEKIGKAADHIGLNDAQREKLLILFSA